MIRTLVLAAVLLAAACSRRERAAARRDGGRATDAVAMIDAAPVREVVMLRRVDLDIVAPTGGHQPDRAALTARFARLGAGVVTEAAAVPAGMAGRGGVLHATLTYDRGAGPSILMTVEAAIDLDGGALGVAARAAGEHAIGRAGERSVVDAATAQLVETVATELTRKLDLRAAPSDQLVAAVAARATEPELAAWALELAGERRDPVLRAGAIEALGEDKPRIRTATIQYLVALGDPSAVGDLTKSVDFTDKDQLAAIMEAATALGGEDARAFLEMLASGASDQAIAERAKEGLKRLDRKEDASTN